MSAIKKFYKNYVAWIDDVASSAKQINVKINNLSHLVTTIGTRTAIFDETGEIIGEQCSKSSKD